MEEISPLDTTTNTDKRTKNGRAWSVETVAVDSNFVFTLLNNNDFVEY